MPKFKNLFEGIIKPFKFGGSNREGHIGQDLERIAAQEQTRFQYQILVSATNNFRLSNKLGEGGFGAVFKGTLDDRREIAVKKLSQRSGQGDKEFVTEATLLVSVQHRNIVKLLGYCAHGTEKLLVYEYVPNGSLDKLLFQSSKKRQLDWKHRYDIITGIAKGLSYLHEESHTCIIHRDIKASNILLDDKWMPKIADFGMARLFPEDQTYVRTRIAGTNGYMAPEYVMHGHLSTKVDVFSFGVLVLELISGQKNSTFSKQDSQNLLHWAYKLHKKGRSLEIMDPTLTSEAASSTAPEQVKLCIHIALLCVQVDPGLRPNMQRVMILLSKKPSNLEQPTRPGITGSRHRRPHLPHRTSSSTGGSIESNSSSFGTSMSTTSASASASTSAHTNSDPHGKRPLHS